MVVARLGVSLGSCPLGVSLLEGSPPMMSRKGDSCLIRDEPYGGQLPNLGWALRDRPETDACVIILE